VAVVFDEKGLEGFRVWLTFDAMHTNLLVMEIQQEIAEDTASPPPSSQSEMYERVRGMIQRQFRDIDFFTHVLVDGKPFPVREARSLAVESRDGRMACSFFVPCPVPAGAGRDPRGLLAEPGAPAGDRGGPLPGGSPGHRGDRGTDAAPLSLGGCPRIPFCHFERSVAKREILKSR
jgi:hypothetical protein